MKKIVILVMSMMLLINCIVQNGLLVTQNVHASEEVNGQQKTSGSSSETGEKIKDTSDSETGEKIKDTSDSKTDEKTKDTSDSKKDEKTSDTTATTEEVVGSKILEGLNLEETKAFESDSEKKAKKSAAETVTEQKAEVTKKIPQTLVGRWGEVVWEFQTEAGILLAFIVDNGHVIGDWQTAPWNSRGEIENVTEIYMNVAIGAGKKKMIMNKNSQFAFSGIRNGQWTGLKNLRKVSGLELLETKDVTDMSGMFLGNSAMASLNVNFQAGSPNATGNVTDMSRMFEGMTSLNSINVSTLDTHNVINMNSMFKDTASLPGLPISNFDTTNVTDMGSMFQGTSSLGAIDIGHFNTFNVKNMNQMFEGMASNVSVDLDLHNFDTRNVTSMTNMFKDAKLSSLTLGPEFRFKSDAQLGAPVSSNPNATGNWIKLGGESQPYTPTEFMAKYGTGDLSPGTYVADTATWGNVPWTFDNGSGVLTFVGGGTLGDKNSSPWNRGDINKVDASKIKKIKFTEGVKAPAFGQYLFSDVNGVAGKTLINVTEFEGLEKLDTSDVTTMGGFFKGMSSLTSLDVSQMSTPENTSIGTMFSGLTNLKTLKLGDFNTSNVTSMDNVFLDTSSLTELDLSSFDASKVTTMSNMFKGMTSLKKLNIKNFNTVANTVDVSNMFADSTNLSELTLGENFRDADYKSALHEIEVNDSYMEEWINKEDPSINMGTSSKFMKNYDGSHPGTYLKEKKGLWGDVRWEFDNQSGTLSFTSGGTLGGNTASPWLISPWNRTDSLRVEANTIKKIKISENIKAPAMSRYLFSATRGVLENSLINVTEIEGLEKLDTSDVTEMGGFFKGMSSLTSLDVSHMSTSNNLSMGEMFSGMTKLTTLKLGEFDTSNVVNMNGVFQDVASLTELDLSHWNTANVTVDGFGMSTMFSGMTKLEKLNIKNFTMANNISKTDMFAHATNLAELTLGENFSDTDYQSALPNIEENDRYTGNWVNKDDGSINMGTSSNFMTTYDGSQPGTYMKEVKRVWGNVPWEFDSESGTLTFTGEGTLGENSTSPWTRTDDVKIDVATINKIVFTKAVKAPVNSRSLFSSGLSLTEIVGLNYLDTSQVTNMSYMFWGLTTLKKLDLSGFDTSNVTTMQRMFRNMTDLTELDISSFDTSHVTNIGYIFDNLGKLNTLILGSKSTFTGDTRLPAIIKNDTYSGYWIKEGENKTLGTSVDFLGNYDGTSPGTYKWESATDSLDPTDPTQQSLTLNKVPVKFDFEAKIQPKSYTLNYSVSDEENSTLEIYNNRLDRDWSVKANVKNNQFTSDKNGTTYDYPITSFKMNEEELVGTGSNGVVFAAEKEKTFDNNLGALKKAIKNVAVSFSDENTTIKAADQLNGAIVYQLYNTATAE